MKMVFRFMLTCSLIAVTSMVCGCGQSKTVELTNPADVPIEQLTEEEQMKVQALSAVDRDRSGDDDDEEEGYAAPQ